jgi:hypothetical protein
VKFIPRNSARFRNNGVGVRRHPARNQKYTTMKNDPYFKFVAVAILAGVIAAFVNPAHSDSVTGDSAAAPAVTSAPAVTE